jgi:hypothetical protein
VAGGLSAAIWMMLLHGTGGLVFVVVMGMVMVLWGMALVLLGGFVGLFSVRTVLVLAVRWVLLAMRGSRFLVWGLGVRVGVVLSVASLSRRIHSYSNRLRGG